MTGVMAAEPIPMIKRAASINTREFANAVRTLPNVKTAIPRSRV